MDRTDAHTMTGIEELRANREEPMQRPSAVRILFLGESSIQDTLVHLYFPCCLQVGAIFFRPRRLPPSCRDTSKTARIPRRPAPFCLSPTQFPASHASFAGANPRPSLHPYAYADT